jgi:hypothetical protein
METNTHNDDKAYLDAHSFPSIDVTQFAIFQAQVRWHHMHN